MNSQLLLAAALLAACPAALHAQAAPPPAPLTAPASPATPAVPVMTLRYKFAVGQVHRYQYEMQMNMLMDTGQTGASIPINMTMKMTMRQTVKSIRPADGAATISTRIESMHMLRNGQETPLPEAQAAKMKQPFTQVMLPTGKILSTEAPAMSGMGGPGMDFGKGTFSGFASLPDGPVKPGDAWTGSGAAPMMGIDVASAFTLNAVKQDHGATLAAIDSKQTGTIDKTITQGTPVPMKMQGQISGKTTQVFDATAGVVQSAQGTSDADMTMLFAQPTDGTAPPPGMPSAMKMQMQMKFQMQRLSDTAPPAAPVQ